MGEQGVGGAVAGVADLVGEAADGAVAVRQTRALRPDVVVMDIRMPGTDGFVATQQISADQELAGVKVVILTTFETDDYVVSALRAGASGFLGKGAEPAELLAAVRTAARGEALLSPAATKGLIERFLAQPARAAPPHVDGAQSDPAAEGWEPAALAALTAREREVLVLVASGLSNDGIGEQLGVSPLTVKTHVNRTMAKLAVRDRAQLVVAAYETGLVRPGG